MAPCIRCAAANGLDDGYCGHCHWVARAELMKGLEALGAYLARWARFADWCAQHDAPPDDAD
jgi:ABC-type nitrate/sulfonate/bicarbonate transport system substrate-binding protein